MNTNFYAADILYFNISKLIESLSLVIQVKAIIAGVIFRSPNQLEPANTDIVSYDKSEA